VDLRVAPGDDEEYTARPFPGRSQSGSPYSERRALAYVAHAEREQRFSLRDPFDAEDSTVAQACNVTGAHRMPSMRLACQGHASWGIRNNPADLLSTCTSLAPSGRSEPAAEHGSGRAQAHARGHPTSTLAWHRNCSDVRHLAAVPHTASSHTEVLPLRLGHRVFVCRTPKVGSTLLRSVWESMRTNMTYSLHKAAVYVPANSLTGYFSVDAQRLMFVRHPVHRIVSGWREIVGFYQRTSGLVRMLHGVPHVRGYPKPPSLDNFSSFTIAEVVTRYDADCSIESSQLSQHPILQHVLPAQHCRCGMQCASTRMLPQLAPTFRVVKIEEEDIVDVLRSYTGLPDRFLPPRDQKVQYSRTRTQTRTGGQSASVGDQLGCALEPIVTARLNQLTEIERRVFGYAQAPSGPCSPPASSK